MRFLFALAAVCFAAAGAFGQSSRTTIVLETNSVTVSNLRPGGTVVLYSVSLVADGYSTTTQARSVRLTDDDHDGVVVDNPPAPVAFRSIWIAVAEDGGDYAVASPTGYFRQAAPTPLLRKHGAAVDGVDWPARFTYLLYVHPESGAWTAFCVDGRDDADGIRNYVTSVALSRLQPVEATNTRKPAELKPGGILFIVDGDDLRATALRVDGALLNGAK